MTEECENGYWYFHWDKCNGIFMNHDDLKRHYERAHVSIQCKFCCNRFPNDPDLDEHINRIHGRFRSVIHSDSDSDNKEEGEDDRCNQEQNDDPDISSSDNETDDESDKDNYLVESNNGDAGNRIVNEDNK